MSYYPAVLVMIGVAALLIGQAPRYTSFAWYYLGFTFFASYFGKALQIPTSRPVLSQRNVRSEIPVSGRNIIHELKESGK